MSNNNLSSVNENILAITSSPDENNGGVIVIDPNKVTENNTIVDRNIKQEDLVLYANLKIIKKPQSEIRVDGNEKKMYNEQEIIINMLNPISEVKTNGITYKNNLTVDYTDYFTNSSINNSNNKTFFDPETFGITNIHIAQNPSFKPIVTIDFIDVQGRTLFEGGNDPSNPYNIFYTLPYPTFILTIKGFYGKAVDYPLVLLKTSTKFDPETGSYKITAEFLSRTFSIYNSFLLIYAHIVPYMFRTEDGEFLGKKILKGIYDQQNEYYKKKYANDAKLYRDYVFKDDVYPELKNLSDQKLDNNTFSSNENENYQATVEQLDSLIAQLKQQYDNIILVKNNPNGGEETTLQLDSYLEIINTQLTQITDENTFANINNAIDINNLNKYYDKKTGLTNIVLDDVKALKKVLDTIQVAVESRKTKLNELIIERDLVNLYDKLGFIPNAYNVSRIIFNNIQAFLVLMNIVYKKALYQIQTGKDEEGNDRLSFHKTFGEYTVSDTDRSVLFYEPFPSYFVSKTTDNLSGYQKTYPGYHKENKNWAEILFIDEIFEAIRRANIKPSADQNIIATTETYPLSNFDIKLDSLSPYDVKTSYPQTVVNNMLSRFLLFDIYSGNVLRNFSVDKYENQIKHIADTEYDFVSHLILNKLDDDKRKKYVDDLYLYFKADNPYNGLINDITCKNISPNDLKDLKDKVTNDVSTKNGVNVKKIVEEAKTKGLYLQLLDLLSTPKSPTYDYVSQIPLTPIYLFNNNTYSTYFVTESTTTNFTNSLDEQKEMLKSIKREDDGTFKNTYLFDYTSQNAIISGSTTTVVNSLNYATKITNSGQDYNTLTLTINQTDVLNELLGFDNTVAGKQTNTIVNKTNY